MAAGVLFLNPGDVLLDDVLIPLLPHLGTDVLLQVLHHGPVAVLHGPHVRQLLPLGLEPAG